MSTLPPSFTSLYRLFLRVSSASVLHQHSAKVALRRSWRPTFEAAAFVIRKSENTPAANARQRRQIELWLQKWEKSMDNTLSMLSVAASSRGLPHCVTRNLASLQHGFTGWYRSAYFRPGHPWNPRMQLANYQALASKKRGNRRITDIDAKAWNALGQVVRMAEGRDRLLLGRVNWNDRKRTPWDDK